MIIGIKDLTEEQSKDMLRKAIAQISKITEEKRKLEDAIKKVCCENDIQYILGLVR